ncbi:MAG: response regulator [Pseudomonadota bacterium]|mgnify:CR=1 FL=1
MNKNAQVCHPIYLPTKVAIVDDDLDYLAHLGLLLDDHLTYDIFTSPSVALREITRRESGKNALASNCYNSLAQVEAAKGMGWAVDLRRIHGIVHDAQRFNHFTVLIVDYAMPEMDGLEVCRQLKGTHIKKILLTGKADSSIAVEAFNQGLIDQYIRKEDVNITVLLNQVVQRLIDNYFSQACLVPNPALASEAPYLFDPMFVDWFAQLRNQNSIVEYYLWGWNLIGGYVMAREDGELLILLVQTPEHAMAHYEIACDDRVPMALVSRIGKREVIPVIGSDRSQWQDRVFPAIAVGNYRCVVVTAAELPDFDTPPQVGFSYRQHLQAHYAATTRTVD